MEAKFEISNFYQGLKLSDHIQLIMGHSGYHV